MDDSNNGQQPDLHAAAPQLTPDDARSLLSSFTHDQLLSIVQSTTRRPLRLPHERPSEKPTTSFSLSLSCNPCSRFHGHSISTLSLRCFFGRIPSRMTTHLVHCFARWEEEGTVILPQYRSDGEEDESDEEDG